MFTKTLKSAAIDDDDTNKESQFPFGIALALVD